MKKPADTDTLRNAAARIDRIESFLLDVPTIRPHKLSMTTIRGQALMIVRVYCADGVVGVGEGTTIGGLAYGAESPEGIKLTVDTYMAPHLIGEDGSRVQYLMARIRKMVRDNHFAKCAVETALLDAHAKRLRVPLSDLLGGARRDTLPIAWTLASGDTGKDIAEAQEMLAIRRHNVFKLKIGSRPVADDIAHVAAIKKALGEQASVRVDVNMAWSETEALRGIAALADVGCDLCEQPVASAQALARLVRRYPIALMADESLHGPETAFNLACHAAADVFAVKVAQSGGLFAGCQVAAIADAAGIELYGGTMLEGAIGTIASAHTFATFNKLQWGTELFGPLLLTEEILTEPLRYADFQLQLPRGPGLGVTLDEDRVNSLRRDKKSVTVGPGSLR
jgi:muconate cycloisomerase